MNLDSAAAGEEALAAVAPGEREGAIVGDANEIEDVLNLEFAGAPFRAFGDDPITGENFRFCDGPLTYPCRWRILADARNPETDG